MVGIEEAEKRRPAWWKTPGQGSGGQARWSAGNCLDLSGVVEVALSCLAWEQLLRICLLHRTDPPPSSTDGRHSKYSQIGVPVGHEAML